LLEKAVNYIARIMSAAAYGSPDVQLHICAQGRDDTDFHLADFLLAFFAAGFLTAFAAFLAPAFVTTVFLAAPFAFRAFGRFFRAARCAAASAVLAHTLNSSESSNNRAGNSQYEFTVTILARV
jgi:hypothetical protein